MLQSMRKKYDAAFKPKFALEAVKGEKTITQIAGEFSVHPKQIRQWRNHLLETLPELFSNRRPQQEKAREELEAELEWLKKNHRRSCRDETDRSGQPAGRDVDCPPMRTPGAGALVVPRSNGEAVFSRFTEKMTFGLRNG